MSKPHRLKALGLAAGLLFLPASAEVGLHVVKKERVRIEVRVVAPAVPAGAAKAQAFDVDEVAGGSLELDVPWPDERTPAHLTLHAARQPARSGATHRLAIDAEVAAAGGPPTRARRELAFDDETTVLFEVARHEDRPLTLALTVEIVTEEVFSAQAVVGSPVELGLEIQWVEQGQTVTLETNQLHTFVGQSVSYAFHLGDPGAERAVELRLFPTLLLGDILQVEIEVNATLPDRDGKVVVTSRRERWLATSRTASTLSLATGDPPRGFRFLVTPRFE